MLIITVNHRGTAYTPPVSGEARFESHARGLPGKLTFSCIGAEEIPLAPGDAVSAALDGTVFFVGFLFSVARDGRGFFTVTAYDALRYFKNRDTVIYESLTAGGLLRRICTDFSLPVGSIADTGFLIPARIENGVTLFDMMGNALDATLLGTGNRYLLHCDNGKLCLTRQELLQSGISLDARDISSCRDTVSIDVDVYTRARLHCYNRSTKQYEITSETAASAADYGILQYCHAVDDDTNAAAAARHLLARKSHALHSVTLTVPAGRIALRGGRLVTVTVRIGGKFLSGTYTAERCVHVFSGGTHQTEVTLSMREAP